MNELSTYLSDRAGRHDAVEGARQRLHGRLGLNMPHGWWPRAADLKAIEAAGFQWIQVASPPTGMLANPRHVARHARALRRALDVTALRPIVHGPADLRLGSPLHNRAFEGLLEYAHQLLPADCDDAAYVVYHALEVTREGDDSAREERALRSIARWAETLGVVICLENLCPVYPGDPKLSHSLGAVRGLVARCHSPAVRMLLDVGHAHVVADLEGTAVSSLVGTALDDVAVFHLHDNLGARRHQKDDPALDPLRLDLHLTPGLGSLPWDSISPALLRHGAPLMLEVHPPHRPGVLELQELAELVLTGATASRPTETSLI